jgi:hypothetical protein
MNHLTRSQVVAAGYRPICPHDWSMLIPDGECMVCGWWFGSDDAVPMTRAEFGRRKRRDASRAAFSMLRRADVLDA